jgi:hypothetical protein
MPRSARSRNRVRPAWTPPPAAAAAASFATSPVYRPRRPAATSPYRVIEHPLKTFLARAEADEIRPIRGWTKPELRQWRSAAPAPHRPMSSSRRIAPQASGDHYTLPGVSPHTRANDGVLSSGRSRLSRHHS